MAEAAEGAIRILVTHHPFDLPEKFHARELIGTRRNIVQRVVGCVDMLLAGHMHISHAGPTALRYKISGQSAIFVQAGTALSSRMRGESNSFQLIETGERSIRVRPLRDP